MGVFNSDSQNVMPEDQYTPYFQYYLMQELKNDIKLTANTVLGSNVINVTTGHGFTGGSYAVLWRKSAFVQARVVSVATNAITLDRPLMTVFDTQSYVIRGGIDMNINGSVTPQEFVFKMYDSIIPVDVTSRISTIFHSAAGDDSKFGSITALTNGVLFGKISAVDGRYGVLRSNADYYDLNGGLTYTDKAGSGLYGTRVQTPIQGGGNYGVVIRLHPDQGDYFSAMIRDDLSSLSRYRVSIIGHYTSGDK